MEYKFRRIEYAYCIPFSVDFRRDHCWHKIESAATPSCKTVAELRIKSAAIL